MAANKPQVGSSNFMPHGYCYVLDPRIVWLNVISDSLITLSFYAIPAILIYFIRKNRSLPFNHIFWMFGTFILACGTTHLMEVWNVWHGSYLLAGVIKGITAAVSVLTAGMLIPLALHVILLPDRMHLQSVNCGSEQEIAERKRVEQATRESLAHSESVLNELAEQKFALDQPAIVATTDVHDQAAELSHQADELRRSQQALESQKLMLQSVLDSIEEGLVATDEKGRFIIWNPAAARIVGLGPANVSSEDWTEHYGLYLPDGVTPFPAEHNPLLHAIQGRASTAQMFVRNPKLEHGTWIEANATPLKDKDGVLRGGVVAFRDITQRRADEREIRKLNDELEARVVQRPAQLEAANEELESFSYAVSHDLRAPLRHISGFSKILAEEYGSMLPSDAQHYLQRILEGTRRMGELVDDLLNLGQIGRHEVHLQVTGLNAIVNEVVDELKDECKGRKVEWKIGSLPSAECDPRLMKQVLRNLLSNAVKFSRLRRTAVIEVGQTIQDGTAVVYVRDNGVGFNIKYADKLFGVFQRLHRQEDYEGTGVGLATVQRIIQKHGGRIWAEAELDKGATFYFTLAASENAELKFPQAFSLP